jgi:hypothetical protein
VAGQRNRTQSDTSCRSRRAEGTRSLAAITTTTTQTAVAVVVLVVAVVAVVVMVVAVVMDLPLHFLSGPPPALPRDGRHLGL